jgi:hypothetical protein
MLTVVDAFDGRDPEDERRHAAEPLVARFGGNSDMLASSRVWARLEKCVIPLELSVPPGRLLINFGDPGFARSG